MVPQSNSKAGGGPPSPLCRAERERGLSGGEQGLEGIGDQLEKVCC